MCFPKAPAVVTRDPAKEASDTLKTQLDMELGMGEFKDFGRRIDRERQLRPQYAQLDIDVARSSLAGDKGNNGLIDLMNQYGPQIARAEQDALSAQRAGDIADVGRLAGASRTAYDQLNPEGAAMLKRINDLRMEEMANPYGMSASQRRESEQNVRGAQSVRGLGAGPTDAFQESMYLGDRQRGLYNERLAGAANTIGLNQSFYGDPFQQILGRPGTTNPAQAYGMGAGVGPKQVFDPYSGYFGEAYASNANAYNASNIAGANNRAAMSGALIGAGAQIGSSLIGAGGSQGGFMRKP